MEYHKTKGNQAGLQAMTQLSAILSKLEREVYIAKHPTVVLNTN